MFNEEEIVEKPVVKFLHDSVRIDGVYTFDEDLGDLADEIIQNQSMIQDACTNGEPDYRWVYNLNRTIVVKIHQDTEDLAMYYDGWVDVEETEYRGYHVAEVEFRYKATLVKFEVVDGESYAFYRLEVF